MRRIWRYPIALLAALAFAVTGAGTATAANWDPPNTILTGSGTWTIATNTGLSTTCALTMRVKSSGSAQTTTVNAAGASAPPTFGHCTNNLWIGAAATSTVPWVFTATSTTAVDETFSFAITTNSGFCTITWGDTSWANNTWSNTTHTLTQNTAAIAPITEHGFCDGGTTGIMSGYVTFPPSVIIT